MKPGANNSSEGMYLVNDRARKQAQVLDSKDNIYDHNLLLKQVLEHIRVITLFSYDEQ